MTERNEQELAIVHQRFGALIISLAQRFSYVKIDVEDSLVHKRYMFRLSVTELALGKTKTVVKTVSEDELAIMSSDVRIIGDLFAGELARKG